MRRAATILLLVCTADASAGELADRLRATLAHPGIAAAGARIESARMRLDAAGQDSFGKGQMFMDRVRYEDQRFVGVLTPTALASPPFAREVSRYGLAYELPVDLRGALAASRRAARGELSLAQLGERQTILLRLHEVTSAWAGIQSLRQQKQALAVQRGRLQQTLKRLEQQVASEQAAIPELRLAEAELARQDADEERLDSQMEMLLAELEQASGSGEPTGASTIPLPAWPGEAVLPSLPEASAAAQVELTSARAEQTERALWPALAAVADYARFDGSDAVPETWSFGVRLSIPLDPGGWQRSRGAAVEIEAALHEREAAARSAKRDGASLRAAWRTAQADARALLREIAAREETLRAAEELQRVGLGALEDSLRQQRDLLEAQFRLVDAQARALQAWSAMQVLSGITAEQYLAALERQEPSS